MRHRPRIDGNHKQIVEALRKAGRSVLSLAGIGKGCPDLLVGYMGANVLMEIKDPEAPKRSQNLTEDESTFFLMWKGPIYLVKTIEDALYFSEKNGHE